MKKNTAYFGWMLLVVLAMAVPCLAMQAPAGAAAAAAKPATDGDAYRTFFEEKDLVKKAALGEKFFTDHKDSEYVEPIFTLTLQAYYTGKNSQKFLDLLDRMSQLNMPKLDAAKKVQFYGLGMQTALTMQPPNPTKGVENGKRVLAIDPNNFAALYTLAHQIIETKAQDPASVDEALGYARKGLAQPNPAGATDAQVQPIRAQLNGDIGYAYLLKKQYPESIISLDEALKVEKKNGLYWYRVGQAHRGLAVAAQQPVMDNLAKDTEIFNALKADPTKYNELNPQLDAVREKQKELQGALDEKLDKAINALATSVAIGGPTKDAAQASLEPLYKLAHNDTTEGMEDLITKKKTEPGY